MDCYYFWSVFHLEEFYNLSVMIFIGIKVIVWLSLSKFFFFIQLQLL